MWTDSIFPRPTKQINGLFFLFIWNVKYIMIESQKFFQILGLFNYGKQNDFQNSEKNMTSFCLPK